MMICGLLGKTLGHSYSPLIHSYLGQYEYRLFEKQPHELEDFLKRGEFEGLNVTMPYKKEVIPYLDALSPIAARLGAVNTIVRREGKLIGHNTDYAGFLSMVHRSGLDPAAKKVLILGSGGASATAVAVMEDLGADVIVISRGGENNYNNLYTMHTDAAIIVNTTPVGMYPNTDVSPINIFEFPALEGVLDVIYNPTNTMLLQLAQESGVYGMSGLWMLVAQAREASEWFQNATIPEERLAEIYRTVKAQMENIVLIGMPGCGKTTVGKALADKLGRQFFDADAEIAKKANMSIPEIFAKEGEEGFRSREIKVLSELGKQSGLVIATGGGCVTFSINHSFLHQNGRIFWLKRDISQLPTDGRPLSQKGNLEEMYRIRKPLYESFADVIIENETVEKTVQQIMEAIQ
jgi:shikimate dehydrogenase